MIFSLILWSIAAFMNAVMDMSFNMYNRSVFTRYGLFWNPAESWRNKWKNGDREQGEKYFGSSTFLVWLTDGWHLAKVIMLGCFIGAIGTFSEPAWWLLVYPVLWFIAFEFSLKLLKK